MGLRKSSKISAEFNMSSLTDIIFLLLIFFMLTSSLVSPNAINLKLPSSSQTKAQATRQPLKITVNERVEYSFNGQSVAFENLAPRLKSAIAADGRQPNDITVILDIHPDVEAQKLVDVVEIITNAGTKMVLSTKAETPQNG